MLLILLFLSCCFARRLNYEGQVIGGFDNSLLYLQEKGGFFHSDFLNFSYDFWRKKKNSVGLFGTFKIYNNNVDLKSKILRLGIDGQRGVIKKFFGQLFLDIDFLTKRNFVFNEEISLKKVGLGVILGAGYKKFYTALQGIYKGLDFNDYVFPDSGISWIVGYRSTLFAEAKVSKYENFAGEVALGIKKGPFLIAFRGGMDELSKVKLSVSLKVSDIAKSRNENWFHDDVKIKRNFLQVDAKDLEKNNIVKVLLKNPQGIIIVGAGANVLASSFRQEDPKKSDTFSLNEKDMYVFLKSLKDSSFFNKKVYSIREALEIFSPHDSKDKIYRNFTDRLFLEFLYYMDDFIDDAEFKGKEYNLDAVFALADALGLTDADAVGKWQARTTEVERIVAEVDSGTGNNEFFDNLENQVIKNSVLWKGLSDWQIDHYKILELLSCLSKKQRRFLLNKSSNDNIITSLPQDKNNLVMQKVITDVLNIEIYSSKNSDYISKLEELSGVKLWLDSMIFAGEKNLDKLMSFVFLDYNYLADFSYAKIFENKDLPKSIDPSTPSALFDWWIFRNVKNKVYGNFADIDARELQLIQKELDDNVQHNDLRAVLYPDKWGSFDLRGKMSNSVLGQENSSNQIFYRSLLVGLALKDDDFSIDNPIPVLKKVAAELQNNVGKYQKDLFGGEGGFSMQSLLDFFGK